MYHLSIIVFCVYFRKEREANAYVENFHFENCKDRYLIMFILRNHLVLEKEMIQIIYFNPYVSYNFIKVSFKAVTNKLIYIN